LREAAIKLPPMNIRFRIADLQDHAPIRELVDQAFRPEDVVTFLDALRAADCLIGEWLAEDASGALGHIAFSRALLETDAAGMRKAAFLTPLAARPDRQRQGVGLQLMGYALRALEAVGEDLFFVIGHPAYYPKAGFSAAATQGVESPWRGKPAFMARCAAPPRGRLVAPAVILEAH